MGTAPKTLLASESDRFYLPELDSLRFFAFLAVFTSHLDLVYGLRQPFKFLAMAGGSGVDLFFTLSAQLITELLLRERARFGRIAVGGFYMRRALRIWPLYFAFLAGLFCLGRDVQTIRVPSVYILCSAVFAGNFAAAWLWPLKISGLILWSVSVEEQFYLAWPCAMRSLSRSQIGAVGLGLLAISILSRVGVLWLGFSARSLQFITFCRLDAIGVGLILSYWLNGDAAVSLKLSRRELTLIGALLWLVGCAAFGGWDRSIGSVIGYSMVALGSGALFLAAIGSHGRMRNPALVYLGRISYGLYIFHGTVLLLVAAAFGRNPISCIVALAATIGIAAASYRWLESPFLRLKKRFERLPSRPV